MTHDPLCPQPVQELSRPGLTVIAGTCHCATIAKVREDERANVTKAFLEGQRDMLAKCISAVRWVELISAADEYLSRRSVLAALRALQP